MWVWSDLMIVFLSIQCKYFGCYSTFVTTRSKKYPKAREYRRPEIEENELDLYSAFILVCSPWLWPRWLMKNHPSRQTTNISHENQILSCNTGIPLFKLVCYLTISPLGCPVWSYSPLCLLQEFPLPSHLAHRSRTVPELISWSHPATYEA